MTVIDPVALGWHPGRPCGDCGALVFDVVAGPGGEVACQCPRYHLHRRARTPGDLEVLGTFDTTTGVLDLFPAPFLASEMEPEEAAIEHGPDVMDACPSWEGDEAPMLAGVLVRREWDGDVSKTCPALSAAELSRYASFAPSAGNPPPLGTSPRPPMVGRALWYRRADSIPVECPRGVPADALGWGFEGDPEWSPLRSAGAAGVVVLPAPKSRGKKPSPPPLMESFA